ncbi:hypothetical protein BLNAU_12370 [Blattamonas nauphoetae]|uniref:Uncharacterized protein n=1 Tax=Blattamonas nauphoetae TaxID=2049346 RepID=A0ABQ9XQX9_9EUKA|nr:hypothetical protein BLNAU_12370 [Blattamonas nauphoetae]
MTALDSKITSSTDSTYPDCSSFLNWSEENLDSFDDAVVVFRSLVATVKLQPVLDDSLEAKAVKFLESAVGMEAASTEAKDCLDLVKSDVIPQLINTLNALSLSLTEAVDLHSGLIFTIFNALRLLTPDALENAHDDELQAVLETVLQHVVAPSEKILQIFPYYQRTMDFILHLPVILTIPSCLTIIEFDEIIWDFLTQMIDAQQEWNEQGGNVRQMRKTVLRMLRMEGIEDVIEEKLFNDFDTFGLYLVINTIKWSNMQGMNVLQRW